MGEEEEEGEEKRRGRGGGGGGRKRGTRYNSIYVTLHARPNSLILYLHKKQDSYTFFVSFTEAVKRAKFYVLFMKNVNNSMRT